MGTLTYGMNVSVDGYIADANGGIEWTGPPDDELHQYWNDREREIAVALYGRRLYDLMSAYWPTADQDPAASPITVDFAQIWREMPKVVFSRTLESVDWNSRLERGDVVEVATRLKAETDGLLEVAGATLAAPLVRAGLGGRVPDRGHTHRGGRRHAVLHGAGQLGEPEPGGDPDVPRRRDADPVRDEAMSTGRILGP